MAIQTSIARHFAIRLIVISIVMFVLGAWGVYDYVVAIPAQQRVFDRYQAMSLTQRALQPDLRGDDLETAVNDATAAIGSEIDALLDKHAPRAGVPRSEIEGAGWREMLLVLSNESIQVTPEVRDRAEFQRSMQLIDSMRATNELEWMKLTLLFEQAVRSPRSMDGELTELQRNVYQMTEQQLGEIAKDETPTPPSTFDRAVQWAFISCLVCVPYFLWVFVVTKNRVYVLEDDGTLRTPERTLAAEEIEDIDMSKWMAKSVAYVVPKDGERIMLDDYKHKDMYLIVGALAHKFHPEDWTPEAKVVKAEGEEGDDEAQAEQDAVDAVLDGEKQA